MIWLILISGACVAFSIIPWIIGRCVGRLIRFLIRPDHPQ